jgi:hypothetical protein
MATAKLPASYGDIGGRGAGGFATELHHDRTEAGPLSRAQFRVATRFEDLFIGSSRWRDAKART